MHPLTAVRWRFRVYTIAVASIACVGAWLGLLGHHGGWAMFGVSTYLMWGTLRVVGRASHQLKLLEEVERG